MKHLCFALVRRFEMKTKKIITATLLSAGLILGSTSAAVATDPTPTSPSTVTLVTYKAQLAAYNTSLVAYDSATITFKAQVTILTLCINYSYTSTKYLLALPSHLEFQCSAL